ncbi:hypothetical protein JCM1840_001104 [Sporobolomyces johnsonii]
MRRRRSSSLLSSCSRLLALVSLASLLLPSVYALATTHRCAERRSESEGGLQSGSSGLSQAQVDGIEGLLNRTAVLSWEIGTHLEALIEFSYPSLSPFSSSDEWASPSPSTSPLPMQVLETVSYLLVAKPPSPSQLQIVQDGSSADPASIGPFVVLANWTLADGGTLASNGTSSVEKAVVEQAVENQLEALLEQTPRTDDGAISHRVDQVALWSDFVYMVPPFLAYTGALNSNATLLQTAYDQCRLYRQYLLDPAGTGLWRHIVLGSAPDAGLWATGNGWAANGMLRVAATLNRSVFAQEFESEVADLQSWVNEIVTGAWGKPQTTDGLVHNYLDDATTFGDAAATALLTAATFRLAALGSNSNGTSVMPLLVAAETAYQTLTSTNSTSLHVSAEGVLSPVVDPVSYGEQLEVGGVSPEGEAFVLLMESGRRDWIEAGGDLAGLGVGGSAQGGGGGKTSGARGRERGMALRVVVVLGAVGWGVVG